MFVLVTGLLFFFISFGWWRTTWRQRDLLIQSERKSVASMFSAILAHDLNNMLMGLMGLLDELRTREKNDTSLAAIRDSVEASIHNLTPLAKRMASTARQLQPESVMEVDVAATVYRILDLARKHPDVRVCTVRAGEIPKVMQPLSRDLFEQALLNLVINAAQAAGHGGQVEIRAHEEGNPLVLEIHDNGPGIPPDLVEAVFQAGFTTKTEGSGLGLLAVKAFAASCGGRLSVSSSPLGGALFRLEIPRLP